MKSHRCRIRRPSAADSEKGSAILELAVVAPVFVLFILGMIDLGQILQHHMVMTQLAYEGVKQAAFSPGVTEMNNCECTFQVVSGSEVLNTASCTSVSYDTAQYTNAPPIDLCRAVHKLYGIHRAESDLRFDAGSLRLVFDFPFPDNIQNGWRFQVFATLSDLFTNFLFNNLTIRTEAVGPDVAV